MPGCESFLIDLQIDTKVFLAIADIRNMETFRAYFAKDSDEIILDIITTLIVGGAIVCLAGLSFAPTIFIPIALVILAIVIPLAIFG